MDMPRPINDIRVGSLLLFVNALDHHKTFVKRGDSWIYTIKTFEEMNADTLKIRVSVQSSKRIPIEAVIYINRRNHYFYLGTDKV